jgi:hypothetical protein
MAEFRKRGPLAGAKPRPADDLPGNLDQPETAPAAENDLPPVDRRTLRRTGRDTQLNAKVTPAFHDRVKKLAFRHKMPIGVLLEQAVALWVAEHGEG